MALINKSDSEKLYGALIREIKYNNRLRERDKDRFIDYLVGIRRGTQVNEFVDDEILAKVMMYTTSKEFNIYGADTYLEETARNIRHLLPYGKKTDNYEKVKEELLHHYLGENGIFTNNLFNVEFCSLFDDKSDFFEIMNIISSDDDNKEYFDSIVEFSVAIGKEISEPKLLKREIISFIHDVAYNIDDEEEYLSQRINETRMKYGIYPGLNERTASEISREIEKARGILLKLESIDKKVDEYRKDIDKRTSEGIEKLTQELNSAKKGFQDELDEHLKYLEEQMKNNSDIVFNEVLENAREKLKQIRIACDSLGGTTTKELLRIREEADKSVEQLKNFATSDKALKETIKIAKNSEEIMSGILQLQARPAPGVVVEGTSIDENFLVPKFEMTKNILPAFDKTLAFDKRLKAVEENIKQLEREGYIVPSSIYEVLPWYMLGNKVIYLYGPTQSGKTTLVEILAKAVGTDLIDGGKITEEHSITSFNDVRGKFDENQLFYGLYYGKTVLYDELDNGNPNNLVLLGTYVSSLANKIAHPERDIKAIFAKRRAVPINVNARIVATGNTTGKGRNRQYTARNKFDESSQERMVPFFIGYNKELERRILKGKDEWAKFFETFRDSCVSFATNAQLDEVEGNLTTSDASTIKEIVDNNAMCISNVVRGLFTQTKEDDYLGFLVNVMKKKYDISSDIDIDTLNKMPLIDLNEKQIAEAFVYEATNKDKSLVKRR